MNTRRVTHTLTAMAAAAALSATLTGCNSSATAHPNETIGTCTECTAAPTPTATPTTVDAAAQEKADRAAAEAVWRKFDALSITIAALPADQVEPAIMQVAVDPQLTRLRDADAHYRAVHQAGYGLDISYISWPEPINGKDTAVLSDCQDGSQAGFLDTKTGNKLTVGTPNTPVRGTLQRTPSGWRVSDVELLQGVTCAPGK